MLDDCIQKSELSKLFEKKATNCRRELCTERIALNLAMAHHPDIILNSEEQKSKLKHNL